jgi:hypothetical protein
MGNALGEIFTMLGDLTAGMVGENILSGAPEGYAAAMQRVNFTLPPTVANQHHSMLQPVSRWLLINGEPYMCGPGMMGILGPCKGKGFE